MASTTCASSKASEPGICGTKPTRSPPGPVLVHPLNLPSRIGWPYFSDYSQRMDGSMIGQVRSFNRTVTQRIGALNDAFLSRDRPLGQARLLWEIGPDGSDVRRLRSRLDLDSGYLSRLLRSL